MGLNIVRRIRGNVHGSVDISELEDLVISHPYFQRLRRIKQLAFLSYVFPGATHTRFEHSLGVMHLAGVAWEKLQKNQERLSVSIRNLEDFAVLEQKHEADQISHGLIAKTIDEMPHIFGSDYVLQTFRLAGLLHDLGHPPFSHSGERFLPTAKALLDENPELPDYLKTYLEGQIDKDGTLEKGVRHEVLSALLVDRLLTEVNQKSKGKPLMMIEPQDVNAIIVPGITPLPQSPLVRNNTYQILRELISGELDIDRMDYLLRDARECGVVYGIFDAGRILDSICLYFDPEDQAHHVAIGYSGLAAFEDYLRARHSMYLQLYFHKTSVAAEAMMQHVSRLLNGYRLPASIEAYARVDEYCIGPILIDAAKDLGVEVREKVEQTVMDMIYHRRLWKRVYEVTSKDRDLTKSFGLNQVKRILRDKKVAFEELSSGGSLTRFLPREPNERSRNALRLIKKDERQILRVQPIEDYCQVIHQNNSTYLSRIYVDYETATNQDIKAAIQRDLISI